jgi:hypothetical protein
MSSVLKNLGQLHIVTGAVAADGESMTSNDGSASIATVSAGLFTVTFGQPFLSAPVVTCSVVDATWSTDAANGCNVVSVATNTVQIQAWEAVTNGTATDILNVATDLPVQFIAVGMRDN